MQNRAIFILNIGTIRFERGKTGSKNATGGVDGCFLM
jgi:hypothetical protein